MSHVHSEITGRYVTLEVQGRHYRVFYLESGDGPPIVCQHTAGCHNHQWLGLLEDAEVTSRYRVIAYDLPRHGKSDPALDHEWWKEQYRLDKEFFVEFIVAFCDALDLDKPIFMGCSFGAAAALNVAIDHPDRLSAIIPLEATDKDQSPGTVHFDWWNHPQANTAEVGPTLAWDLMSPLSPEPDRRSTWWWYSQCSDSYKGDTYFYGHCHDVRDRLHEIQIPVVVLTGNYDYVAPPEDGQRVAAGVADGEFVLMEGIGHFPMSENYPLFRGYLLQALESIERRVSVAS